MSQSVGRPVLREAGFTMVELITVMIVMGILGALAVSRFFDKTTFEAREYADQVKSLIRYAQKQAIAQNRPMYVNAFTGRFAVCTASGCGAGTLMTSPAGSNSGSSTTKAQCTQGGNYVSSWLCEGKPSTVTLASSRATEAGGAGSYFAFDAMGRPYNAGEQVPAALGASSSFNQALTLTFSASGTSYTVTVEPETGYVH